MSENEQGWALDPWSEEPRWICVPASIHAVKLPRPGSDEITALYRHTYTFPWLAPEVFYLFGETKRARQLMVNLGIAITFCAWIKRITGQP